jgi:hypothetical protein
MIPSRWTTKTSLLANVVVGGLGHVSGNVSYCEGGTTEEEP